MSAIYAPGPIAAPVIERYGLFLHSSKASALETARSQRTFLAHMRAMQRELIQAYLPDMGLTDALRAARTPDHPAAVDAAEARPAGGVPAVFWDGRVAA